VAALTTDAARAEIERHLSDRTWRLNNLYYIKDKSGKKIKFRMNWAQQKLFASLWYFNIILKARQLGFTTFTMIYFLDACLFNSNHAAGIIAHTQDDASDLFENKAKFAYKCLPKWLRDQRDANSDSAKKLVFSNGSSFTVGTSLRSGTYQKLLISEYGKVSAKYPEKAREIKTGALNTVEKDQQIIVESTAEGKSGEFFELCEIARKLQDAGKTLTRLDPRFHFFAWFDNPEYRLSDEETELTTIPQEVSDYLDKFPLLDRNQRAWYAGKFKIQGADMKREFPSTAQEAFEGSLEGAYYAKEMSQLRNRGQIGFFPYDRRYPVRTFWDIGQGADQMSIIFYQEIGGRKVIIDYHESNNEGWDFYAKLLAGKDYNYSRHDWPHDGNKRIVGLEVLTSRQLATSAGIKPIYVVKRTNNVDMDVRNHCKPALHNIFFNEEKASLLVNRLDNYKRRWDDTNSMWLDEPRHDENSHGADAFRTLVMALLKQEKETEREAENAVSFAMPMTSGGWMG
jgi:hypothetical protein